MDYTDIAKSQCYCVTQEDVKLIVDKYGHNNEDVTVENYIVTKNSEIMQGFVSDYWKLVINIAVNNKNDETKRIQLFIKAIPKTNEAKANMVKQYNLFHKELTYYKDVKNLMKLSDTKPWSAKFITALPDALVFEHLDALEYSLCNKFKRFDMAHTLQALNTLSRFHAFTIICEEKLSNTSQSSYRINEHFAAILDQGFYNYSSDWFIQCMTGALEAIKTFSRYGNDQNVMEVVESRWHDIWHSAVELGNVSSQHRNVICHSDLWNNNILFHYKMKADGTYEPDDCLLVDFPGVRYQPPAGDIMFLLYCNLEPQFRRQNMDLFLNYYYEELSIILQRYKIRIESIMPRDQFLMSAQEQQLWGNIVCACLMPSFWVDEDLATDIFCDTEKYNEIMTKNKASFIKKNMESNPFYKSKVMEIYEEIVENFCLKWGTFQRTINN